MFAPSDYSFELPPELVAQQPTAERDGSRLLHVGEVLADLAFPAIIDLLPRDAILIANDTRVIPARVLGHKPSGGNVELLVMEPASLPSPPGTTAWRCLARARRPLRPGQRIQISTDNRGALDRGAPVAPLDGPDVPDNALEVLAERDEDGSITIALPGDGLSFLDVHGHIPLPRYIDRADGPEDRERYQTMFARVPGAVAAPTAGLHMTPAIRDALVARGIAMATVTLHVGWGTFAPIRVHDVRMHQMHRERYEISEATAKLVASGRPVVALGTTALRALESAATGPHALAVGSGATELFVYPGGNHAFRIVDHLITNFHLPESTLLMLVCAFAGTERVLAAYRHAIAAGYRFYSYGDAMLVHRV